MGSEVPDHEGAGEGPSLQSVATNAARWHSKPASWRSAGVLKERATDFETLDKQKPRSEDIAYRNRRTAWVHPGSSFRSPETFTGEVEGAQGMQVLKAAMRGPDFSRLVSVCDQTLPASLNL